MIKLHMQNCPIRMVLILLTPMLLYNQGTQGSNAQQLKQCYKTGLHMDTIFSDAPTCENKTAPHGGGSRICLCAAYADGAQCLVMTPKTTGDETWATAVSWLRTRSWMVLEPPLLTTCVCGNYEKKISNKLTLDFVKNLLQRYHFSENTVWFQAQRTAYWSVEMLLMIGWLCWLYGSAAHQPTFCAYICWYLRLKTIVIKIKLLECFVV